MTWAKVSDTFIDDPALLRLPRGLRLLFVEGTVWCCKHETDGEIPAHVLRRLTDEPRAERAAAQLVEAGLWARTEDGYRVRGFFDDQRSREDLAQDRLEADERQRRMRLHRKKDHSLCLKGGYCPSGQVLPEETRSRRHKRGDHSLCVEDRYCSSASVTRDELRDRRRESQEPDPTRPDPTRPEGHGERSEAPQPPGVSTSRECEHGTPDGLELTKAKTPRCVMCRREQVRVV